MELLNPSKIQSPSRVLDENAGLARYSKSLKPVVLAWQTWWKSILDPSTVNLCTHRPELSPYCSASSPRISLSWAMAREGRWTAPLHRPLHELIRQVNAYSPGPEKKQLARWVTSSCSMQPAKRKLLQRDISL